MADTPAAIGIRLRFVNIWIFGTATGWPPCCFASEFLFVVLRHIEDSAGRLNMVNAIHNVHLNTLLQEAEAATLRKK